MNDIVPRFTRPFGYVEVVDENLEVGGIIATVCQGWRGGRGLEGGRWVFTCHLDMWSWWLR